MSQLAESLYQVADRLEEMETVDEERAKYLWDEQEYDSFHQLLDESDLVGERPETDPAYADFMDSETADRLIEEAQDSVDARLLVNEGDTGDGMRFDSGDAASVFYSWMQNRGSQSYDTEPEDDDVRPQDDDRVYKLHDQPFVTLQETDDGVQYSILTVGIEEGESACLYIHERFPGDMVYMEGALDATTAEEVVDAGLESGEEERAPELVEDAEAFRPDDAEEALGDTLGEMHDVIDGSADDFGYEEYVELAEECEGTIQTLDNVLDSLQEYYRLRAIEHGAVPDPNEQREQELHRETPEFYQNVIEERLEDLADGYDNARHAIRFSDLGTHRVLPYRPAEDGAELVVSDDSDLEESWVDRLRLEHPETYETLHDHSQAGDTARPSLLDSFRPSMEETPSGDDQMMDPGFLLAQIQMQGFDAVDDFLDEVFEEGEAAGFEGNETTTGMFQ